MHPRFLSFLCCPDTGEELRLEVAEYSVNGMVKSGRLICGHTNAVYPIINGIPRFVNKELYSSSFGYEWRKWPKVQFDSENIGKTMEGHTSKMFQAITGFDEDLGGRSVVEFGCGPGRFLDVVRRRGGTVVGIDMSLAVEAARENFSDDNGVLIVQGDILNPPFKKDCFDLGYTIGVLHHTPEPAKGLKALTETVHAGGGIACCVYPKEGFYAYPSVACFRKLNHAVSVVFGSRSSTYMSLAYSYFAAYILFHMFNFSFKIPFVGAATTFIEKNLLVTLYIPDARWRILDIFDAITPYYASTHTPEEVSQWFVEAGCCKIRQTDWGNTSFAGIKAEKT